MRLERILVPVDYSEPSRAALVFAAGLAEPFGAALDVVHVWERPSYVPSTLVVGEPGKPSRTISELIAESAEREMSEFINAAELPEISFDCRLVSGEPVSAILAVLAEARHQVVVVGTHGRTALQHLLLGSVTEKLVRASPVPVLSVPSPRS